MAKKTIRIYQPKKNKSWRKIKKDVGPTAKVYAKPIDENILSELPAEKKTFLERGVLDRFTWQIRGLLANSEQKISNISE